jgi:6-phosphogluconolactonase
VPTEVPAHVRPAVLRLTLTCPVLNAAANVLFMVTGAGKAAAVHRALAEEGSGYDLPSRQIRPKNGALTWLLDKAAASELP